MSDSLVRSLEAILSPGQVLCNERARMDAYTVDVWLMARRDLYPPRVRPVAVLPDDTAEVARVMRWCHDAGVPVRIRGAGAGDTGGALPRRDGEVIVDTRRLRTRALAERDQVATVGVGWILLTVEEWLRRRAYTLGHLPASISCSSVGGFLANAGSGILSTRYGKLAENVVSLVVVLPDGEVLRTPRVRAHAMGPDLNSLFLGSEGIYGVVTEADLRLHRLTPLRLMALSFPSFGAGIAWGRRVTQLGLAPALIRLYDEEESRGLVAEGSDCIAVVGVDGVEAIARVEVACLRDEAQAAGARLLPDAVASDWYGRRMAPYFPPNSMESRDVLHGVVDFVARYTDIEACLAAVREELAGSYPELHVSAHCSHWLSYGTMAYLSFWSPVLPRGQALWTAYYSILERIFAGIRRHGALMNEHHGVGVKLRPFFARQYEESGVVTVLERLKQALDPRGLINAGNMLEPGAAPPGAAEEARDDAG